MASTVPSIVENEFSQKVMVFEKVVQLLIFDSFFETPPRKCPPKSKNMVSIEKAGCGKLLA